MWVETDDTDLSAKRLHTVAIIKIIMMTKKDIYSTKQRQYSFKNKQ